MPITTHILDVSRGRPAPDVEIVLEREDGGRWTHVGRGRTDADGRTPELVPDGTALEADTYRLTFATRAYFAAHEMTSFYPSVQIAFDVADPGEHYHVPLLLSAFGYSTYRGS